MFFVIQGQVVKKTVSSIFIFALAFSPVSYGHGENMGGRALVDLPLETLMEQQVSSISKKLQRIEDTPAAAYVITAQDIEHSGATTIPDVLRLAPGVDVAAISNNKWAVSIRGFNSRLASKVLVMLDGRAIYPTIYPGTLWENNDIPLELIERVEVLRGPGSAIWGSNAMNGVINIITKSSHDTVGGDLGLTLGSEVKGIASGNYGWALDQNTSFRLYAQARKSDASELVSGGSAFDEWESQNIGFRLDKELQQGRILFQGGLLNSHAGEHLTGLRFDGNVDTLTSDRKTDSGHLQVMWEHESTSGTLHTLQSFAEYSNVGGGIAQFSTRTIDLEYQQQFSLGRQDIVWGLGYRLWKNVEFSSPYSKIRKKEEHSHHASFFIQDDISLIPDNLILTLGGRLEQRTGLNRELQPNIRLLWTPDRRNSFWAAVSRTIRIPTITESDNRLVIQPPSLETSNLPVVRVLSPLDSEKMTALDVGWRHQWQQNFSTDITGFVYHYDDLLGIKMGAFTEDPPTFIPLMVLNSIKKQAFGAEVSAKWQPNDNWQFTFNYSWLDAENRSRNVKNNTTIGSDGAKHKASLQLTHQVTSRLEWSAFLRYIDKITILGPGSFDGYSVPAYTSLDLKVKYQLDPDVDISLVGQNLLEASHKEFLDDITISPATEIQRGLYLNLDWRF